jgi:hypothetical protein
VRPTDEPPVALMRQAAESPERGEIWWRLAEAAERHPDILVPLTRFGRAAAGAPESAGVWRGLARLQDAAGRPLDAIMSRVRAWKVERDEETFQALWYGFRALGQGNDPSLFAAFRNSSLAYPALIGQGNAFRSGGLASEAEAPYREAMSLRPDLPFAQSRLGSLLVLLGRPFEANDAFAFAASRARWIEEAIEFRQDLEPTADCTRRDRTAEYPGASEGETDAPFVLLVSCDSRYFQQYGYVLVNSARQTCRPAPAFHVHLISPTPEDQALVLRLRRDFPEIDLFVTAENVVDGGTAVLRSLSSCARFLVLPTVIERYRRPVLVCDIDLVVLRDLNQLRATLPDADVAVIHRDAANLDFWDAYSAAILWVMPTDAGLRFARKVEGYIERQMEKNRYWWYLDQIALYAAFVDESMAGRSLRVASLPIESMAMEHVDPESSAVSPPSPDAYVWSITSSIRVNRAKTGTDLFTRYLPSPT